MTTRGLARARVAAAVLAGGGLLAAGWLTASVGVEAAGAAGQQAYTDPDNDSGSAADVRSVNVSNDDAGKITIKVKFDNRPSNLGNEGISVFVDSDLDPSTGGTGADYRLRYFGTDPIPYAVDRWDTTSNTFVTGSQGSFTGSYAPATQELTFAINRGDLGNTVGFRLWLFTATTAGPGNDNAPDADPKYRYDLQLPPATTPPPPPPPPPPVLRPPVSSHAPEISGAPEVDRELRTTSGDWGGRQPIVLDRQWLRCNAAGDACGAIADETGATYVVQRADLGRTLRVTVTARNSDGTATARSAQTRRVRMQPDTDRDGVPNDSDQCDRKRAGRYDFDDDGCPGPFRRILPRDDSRVEIFEGRIRILKFGLQRVPRGASVVLRARGVRLHARAHAGNVAESRALAGKRLPIGTIFTLKVTKAGWIGYWARLRLVAADPPLAKITSRCIPAVGPQRPVSCKRVDRGK